MSGTATLTRAPAAPAVPSALTLARPSSIGALRGALVAATFAAACLAVGVAKDLVTSFGGTVSTLGRSATYVDDAAALLGWLLTTVALVLGYRAAKALGAPRTAGNGLVVAALGTMLLAASEAFHLWISSITMHACLSCGILSGRMATPFTQEVRELSKASLLFEALGWLVLAVGALVARPSSSPRGARRAARSWRRALTVLGIGVALTGVGAGVALALVIARRSWHSGQLETLGATVPTVVSWLVVALAIVLAGVALRRSPRTARLTMATPFGVLGACLLAAAAATTLVVDEIGLANSETSWLVNLARIGSATAWTGWLALTLAFGAAAARLLERDVLTRPVVAERASQ